MTFTIEPFNNKKRRWCKENQTLHRIERRDRNGYDRYYILNDKDEIVATVDLSISLRNSPYLLSYILG